MKHLPVILILDYVATLILGLLFRDLLSAPVDPRAFFELRTLLGFILVMPFVETVIFQLIWIEGALKIGRNTKAALYIGAALSAAVFFVFHYFLKSPFNAFVYGTSGGISLSVMYVLCRRDGVQKAFFWTWILHACSNTLMILSMAFYGMAVGVF